MIDLQSPIRTYVLDTSVLLSDPWACTRFAEHEVVVPLVVISELEAKRHHHELGWFARQALRAFDDMRIEHGRLDQPIPVGTQGGTLHVELNHSDPTVLPAGFRTDTNDARILTCAANLAAEGKRVTLVSRGHSAARRAGAVGLTADEYHAQDVITSGWTGMAEVDVSAEEIDALFAEGEIDLEDARNMPCTPESGCSVEVRTRSGGSTPTRRCSWFAATEGSGARRSAEQRGGVSTCCSTSRWASRWKQSPRWRCAPGWRTVLERRTQRKSWCSARSTRSAVRNSVTCRAAKATRWALGAGRVRHPGGPGVPGGVRGGVVPRHARGAAADPHPRPIAARLVRHRRRGPVAGAQRAADRAVAARGGSRVVLTHDVAQRDNLRVGRHDGVAAVIEKLKGHPLFAHIT